MTKEELIKLKIQILKEQKEDMKKLKDIMFEATKELDRISKNIEKTLK